MEFDQSFSSATNNGATSPSLLDGVRHCDPEAWRRFAAIYGPIIYRWTVRQGLQEDDAGDIAQEVFRSVAENIQRFEHRVPGDSLRGWLWTVTRNKIRDHYRRSQKEISAQGGTEAHHRLQQVPNIPEESDESPADHAAELSHRALEFIQNEFEPGTWRAFWRTAIDGQSPAEVARELGLTLGAVYKAKSRVLLRLRRELDGLLD